MIGLYLVLTDGTHVVTLNDALPSHAVWPIVRPKPLKHWSHSLLKHISCGLWNVHWTHWKPLLVKRPVSVPCGHQMYCVKAPINELVLFVDTMNALKGWLKAFGQDTWTFKLCSSVPPKMDLLHRTILVHVLGDQLSSESSFRSTDSSEETPSSSDAKKSSSDSSELDS